jgi:hypothetical protein
MTDVSQLSDEQLVQSYLQQKVGSLSDDELRDLHDKLKKGSAKERIDNDAISKGARNFAAEGSDSFFGLSQGALNLLAGAVRGAGSIGATLARPFESSEENAQRRAGIDENMRAVGAQPDSIEYQGGKLGAEVAGTLAVGGIAGKAAGAGLTAAKVAPEIAAPIVEGLTTGGFRVDGAAGVAGAATRAATGAVTGGASAALVDPKDAGAGAAVGAVAAPVVKGLGAAGEAIYSRLGSAAGSAMRKVFGVAEPEVRELAEKAEALGITVPADRLVDSKSLNALASSLSYVPLSGRTATEAQMSARMNQALSRLIGEDTANITSAVRSARVKLGAKFGQFLEQNGVKVDEAFVQDLAEVATNAHRELGAEGAGVIEKQIGAIAEKAVGGELDGAAAYAIKRGLDRISSRSTPEAFYAGELKRKLMSALERSVGPEQAEEFAKLRQAYGTMLDLERLAPNGAVGEISAAKLANVRDINNPALQDLADIAAQFLRPREGAHGSAQRVFGGVGAGTTAALAAAGVPGAAALATGAGALMAAGRGANKVLNSGVVRDAILDRAPAVAAPALEDATTTLGRIGTTAGVAAPVIGAGLLAQPALAEPAPSVQSVANARTTDEAIAAAMKASSAPSGGASRPAEGGAQFTPSGMLTVHDPSGELRRLLAAHGIRTLPASGGRVIVGTRQAVDAMDLLHAAAAAQGQ